MKRRHYYGLDVLRGVSALLIVLYHYTAHYNLSSRIPAELHVNWAVSFPWAATAVVTFFLLSGFLCNIDDSQTPIAYLTRRIVRLYPAFVAAVMITSVVTFFFFRDAFVGLKDILLNLTMVPGILGADSVDGVYWTLKYELLFSLAVAVLLLIKNPVIRKGTLLAWVVCSCIFNVVGGQNAQGAFYSAIRVFLIPDYVQTFVLGVALQSIVKDHRDWLAYTMAAVCLLCHWLWQGSWSVLYLIGSALIVLYVVAIHPDTKLNEKNMFTTTFNILAKISYPLYLLHQNVGYAIIMRLVSANLTDEIFVLIPITVSILLAWAVHNLIEVPVSRLIKK